MNTQSDVADFSRHPASADWAQTQPFHSIYDVVRHAGKEFAARPAMSFQLTSGPGDKALTLTHADLLEQVTKAANLFRSLGVGEGDAVALILPNAPETVIAMLGAMCAGIVNPINPLLEAQQIAAILRETKAKVVVTLRSFPKTDLAQKTAEAVAHAPSVKTVLEVDLLPHLSPPKSWLAPLLRPKNPNKHHAKVLSFRSELRKQSGDQLSFTPSDQDRVVSYFHTGGTTGTPKVAQHFTSGVIYQGWMFLDVVSETDCFLCPLPMFHVLAGHSVLGTVLQSGAHMVLPTPQGYRGDGVFENFWKLTERYKASFLVMVPTAASALMQQPVDADVSSLRYAISGSAPMPTELFKRFEKATGLEILEGYGMTENTCMVTLNPVLGEKKIGSVGQAVRYCDVKILDISADGDVRRVCETDEIGEICLQSPSAIPSKTYLEQDRNEGLFTPDGYLRTGDLGRIDPDGYVWITGRAKDLIIRGGHNIDPAEIEDTLLAHHDVSLAAAVGQPDLHSGEVPCAYVELVAGATLEAEALQAFAASHIHERAAVPKHIEIVEAMPVTHVGKVFKPELRKRAIARVYSAALADAGVAAQVLEVVEDKERGLIAILAAKRDADAEQINTVLSGYVIPWRWCEVAG